MQSNTPYTRKVWVRGVWVVAFVLWPTLAQADSPLRVEVVGRGVGDAMLEALRERLNASAPFDATRATGAAKVEIEQSGRNLDVSVVSDGRVRAHRSFNLPVTTAEIWLFVKSALARLPKKPANVSDTPTLVQKPPPTSPSPPTPRTASNWEVNVGVALGRPQLASIGPMVRGVFWQSQRVRLTAGAGYGINWGGNGLTIHHIPLSASGGWKLGDGQWVLGTVGKASAKFPTAKDKTTTAIGAAAGLFIQVFLPIARRQLDTTLRVEALGQIRRHRYLSEQGSVSERPWSVALSMGVAWP